MSEVDVVEVEQKDIRKMRRDTEISQTEYWGRIYVSLSYGCVIENCSKVIPKRIKLLWNLAYSSNPLYWLAKLRRTTIEQLIKDGK